MLKFAPLALLAFLSSLALACVDTDECNCEPNCWEKCFNDSPRDVPDQTGQAYIAIYNMVMGIRNLYGPCFKPHGTAYTIDGTVPNQGSSAATNNLYHYQRLLASIVSIVQPVSSGCNQMCTSKYFNNFAFYAWSWMRPCRDRCEAAELFQSSSFSHYVTSDSSSWPKGGSILGNHCFNNPQFACMNCTRNELILSFTNSLINPSDSYCQNNFRCAIIGTNPAAQYDNMQGWADPGLVYLLPYDPYFYKAATSIYSCLSKSCCSQNLNTFTSHSSRRVQDGDSLLPATADRVFYTDVSQSSSRNVVSEAPSIDQVERMFAGRE